MCRGAQDIPIWQSLGKSPTYGNAFAATTPSRAVTLLSALRTELMISRSISMAPQTPPGTELQDVKNTVTWILERAARWTRLKS